MIKRRMPCLYNSQKDLSDRLHGTICMYDGVPFNVTITGSGKIILCDFETGNEVKQVAYNDEAFDISSLEVGYTNIYFQSNRDMVFQNSVQYVIRNVAKRYKQGLNTQAVSYTDIDGNEKGGNSVGLYNCFGNLGFKESLMDQFPTLQQGMKILDEGVIAKPRYNGRNSHTIVDYECKEIAVSKQLALKRTDVGVTLVFLKTRNIGWIAPKEKLIHIPDSNIAWIVLRYMHGFEYKVE